jgi:hypothetical protein
MATDQEKAAAKQRYLAAQAKSDDVMKRLSAARSAVIDLELEKLRADEEEIAALKARGAADPEWKAKVLALQAELDSLEGRP